MTPDQLTHNTIYHCRGGKLRKFLREVVDDDGERMALCRNQDSGINSKEPLAAFARPCLRERAQVRTAMVRGRR